MPTRNWIRKLLAPAIRPRSGFMRNDRGAVAVEFGLLAIPFFAIICAILETAVVFFAGQMLDAAVQDASRNVRTGEAQTLVAGVPNWDDDDFKQAVCDGLYGMFDCDELKIKVSVIETFADAELGNPINDECSLTGLPEDCGWTIEETYTPGSGADIVQVEAYYKWPTIVNLPMVNLATQAGNTRLLSAVRVFKNEPFS